ncbi:MAG TPA: hypothetical protein VMJ92_02890 [Candidatus Limnocylindrales bacterium]|nr:hypothetical protein [Candidatus Limnocylindrales bacterium]
MKLLQASRKIALTGGLLALALTVGAAGSALAAGTTGAAGAVVAQIPGGVVTFLQHGPFGGGVVLTAAATYIGISEEALRAALGEGKTLAQVAEENGKTRDGLIAAITDALSQRITEEVPAIVDRTGPIGHGPGRGFAPFLRHAGIQVLNAAADHLGLTPAEVREQLAAGQTLGEIADATAGTSREGIIAALVAAANSEIDAKVAEGDLTAEQAERLKATQEEHMTRLVDSERLRPVFRFR